MTRPMNTIELKKQQKQFETNIRKDERDKVLDEVNDSDMQLPSSTNLLLIAHDEWKRREERRHIHEEMPWVHGWISGFLTSRKFVKEQLEKIHKNAELRQQHREQE
jgi:hypothetical protein